TNDVTQASSWEGWVATNRFVPVATHAYTAFQPVLNNVPSNASPPQLIYDTNARRYIAMFVVYTANNQPGPVYFMTTPSLANPVWSTATLINGTATLQINPRASNSAASCSTGFVASNYVSVIDTHSDGLNFEFTDGDPWLFYVYNPALRCG